MIWGKNFNKNKSSYEEISTVSSKYDIDTIFTTNNRINAPAEIKSIFLDTRKILFNITKKLEKAIVEKRLNRIVEVLAKLEPSIVSLSLGSEDTIYCDIGLPRLMPMNIMGDGLIRILEIILVISDTEDGVVFIDEIENGLYFQSQTILWDAVLKASEEFNVQVFATTHSLETIKALVMTEEEYEPSNENAIRLFRVEKEDGILNVVNYDHDVLEASLE